MRLVGFLIVLHVTPHPTCTQPLKLSHWTSYQTMPHSSQPQSICRIAIQAGTGFGFVSDIIYLASLCSVYESVFAQSYGAVPKAVPSVIEATALDHLNHSECRLPKNKLELLVNWLIRHLSFSTSWASLQSLGLSLHSLIVQAQQSSQLKCVILLSC